MSIGAWQPPRTCHTVYRGQDGNMNYDDIQSVMGLGDSQVSIPNQALPANTIWHYIRRQVSDCGKESLDSAACVVVIDSGGDMIGDTPNSPMSLVVEQLAGGKLKLKWRYTTINQEVAPTGFKVYQDSGSGFNFTSPTATVAAKSESRGEYSWTSGALSHGNRYRFVVRSYKQGAGEDQNLSIVSAVADSQGPAAITGIRATWQEI